MLILLSDTVFSSRLYEAKQEVLEDLKTGFTKLESDIVDKISSSTTNRPDPPASDALLQQLTTIFAAKLAISPSN
jgi:hypothetical protein